MLELARTPSASIVLLYLASPALLTDAAVDVVTGITVPSTVLSVLVPSCSVSLIS